MTFAEWARGRFRTFGDNELALEDLPNDSGDPPKFRLAARAGSALGCLSWNRLRTDDNHEEKVLIIGKATGPSGAGGMLDIFCQDPNVSGDPGMKRVMEVYHDRVVFHVPAQVAGQSDRLVTPDGRGVFVFQGDGNLVLYDMQTGQPKWASNTANWGTNLNCGA